MMAIDPARDPDVAVGQAFIDQLNMICPHGYWGKSYIGWRDHGCVPEDTLRAVTVKLDTYIKTLQEKMPENMSWWSQPWFLKNPTFVKDVTEFNNVHKISVLQADNARFKANAELKAHHDAILPPQNHAFLSPLRSQSISSASSAFNSPADSIISSSSDVSHDSASSVKRQLFADPAALGKNLAPDVDEKEQADLEQALRASLEVERQRAEAEKKRADEAEERLAAERNRPQPAAIVHQPMNAVPVEQPVVKEDATRAQRLRGGRK
jgi:hypothetical protein